MSEGSGGAPRHGGRIRAIKAVESRMAQMRPPLSVTSLAARAEVKRDTIDLFLRGERWPQMAKRAAIERVLGWPAGRIEEIAGGTVEDATNGNGVPASGDAPPEPGEVGRLSDSAASGQVNPSDFFSFLAGLEDDLKDPQHRQLWEMQMRAEALRRKMEILGEL